MALVQGQRFPSWEAFSCALEDWSIQDHFKVSVVQSDRTRKVIKCGAPDVSCPFHIRAFFSNREEQVEISTFNGRHTCVGAQSVTRPTENHQRWLSRVLPETIAILPSTRPAEIIAAVQLKHHVTISYDAAYRARRTALSDSDDAERVQYQMLGDYLDCIKTKHPSAHIDLVNKDTRRMVHFERLFICPPTSGETFRHCRPFIALDGTFTKGTFKQILQLAVGLDAENRGVVLAWGLVPTESEKTWSYFMAHLKIAIPEVDAATTTIMSDRDKGLARAGSTTLPLAQRVYCTQHISENIRPHFGLAAQEAFRLVASTLTMEDYQEAMRKLLALSTSAYEYVESIPLDTWAGPHVIARRYGHTTSKLVESINSSLVDDRKRAPVDLLSSIWLRQMQHRFDRYQETFTRYDKHDFLVQYGSDLYRQAMGNTHQLRVQISDLNVASVTEHGNRRYIVNLNASTCTCGLFQQNSIPCGHAIAFIHTLRLSPRHYINPFLTVAELQSSYTGNFQPVDAGCLFQNPLTREPLREQVHHTPGQRVTARRQAGGRRSRRREDSRKRCGRCREVGHDITHCTAGPVV